MTQKNQDFVRTVKVDEYEIRLIKGQISLYNMNYGHSCTGELVRGIDIKNVMNEREEFEAFVEKFKAAHEARKATKK